MKKSLRLAIALLSTTVFGGALHAQQMAIDSLTGPVTQNEINAFKAYMAAQTPDSTPWGAGHNAWADGTSGNALEAFGLMWEVTGDTAILNSMIHWTDICVSERNDLMPAAKGGQRVMWTGKIEPVWCPQPPTSSGAGYAGGENGDTKAHIAYTALEILYRPSLWNQIVPDGDPFGNGATYLARAKTYVQRCDEGNLAYDIPIFVTSQNLIRNPSNWPSGYHTMEANNIQMMLAGSFQRQAECHEILGDNPSLQAQYDTIAKTVLTECINGMAKCHPGTAANGDTTYAWCYYPWSIYPANLETVGHAAYDILGVYRGFSRPAYGFSVSLVTPYANGLTDVMYRGNNTFSPMTDGTGTSTQNYMQAQWILLSDFNPNAYNIVATADFASGRYKTTTLMTATLLWMKDRRNQAFELTASPASQSIDAGKSTSYSVQLTPLGGVFSTVNLSVSGLPSGASASFSPATVALSDAAGASSTLQVTTGPSTPAGNYTLTISGKEGTTTQTTSVNLTVTVPTYTITASAGANGSISPSGSVVVNGGANQTFTISPNAGYIVSSVMVDNTNVGVVTSYTFNNVQASHWIGATFTAATTEFNDTDTGITYTGTWSYSANHNLADYQNDVHFTKTNGNSVSYAFTGTGIDYVTETNSDEGNVSFYIDGVLKKTVNCASPIRQTQQVVFSATGLAAGTHTLKAVKVDGTYLLLDALIVHH